eukprot:1314-Heterococcus_DN1.PRE.1
MRAKFASLSIFWPHSVSTHRCPTGLMKPTLLMPNRSLQADMRAMQTLVLPTCCFVATTMSAFGALWAIIVLVVLSGSC